MLEAYLSRLGNERTCPVAVMIRAGKMLIGRREYPTGAVWTAPGGRCEIGETIEEALRREVYEEVGITAFTIQAYMGESRGADEHDIVPLFLCTTEQDATRRAPEKFSEWRWVTVDEYITGDEYSGFNPHVRTLIDTFF